MVWPMQELLSAMQTRPGRQGMGPWGQVLATYITTLLDISPSAKSQFNLIEEWTLKNDSTGTIGQYGEKVSGGVCIST